MKRLLYLMIALLPLTGCDHFRVYTVGEGENSGNPEGQGGSGENQGGEGQSGDSFVYEVAATQPSGAVKQYTKDLWLRREKGPGDFQWMVVDTKVAYDSKGRIAREEESVTWYAEGGGQDGPVNRTTRYRLYDDKAGKMEIRKSPDNPNTAILKGELNAEGNLTRVEIGGYNGSKWESSATVFEYTADGLLSKVSYPDASYLYPFEFSWSNAPGIVSIQEKDPRTNLDPEEDESRNYVYASALNPTFGAALDIASFASFAHVFAPDYPLPLGKGSRYLVDYANTTYRNEAEKFTYEWNSDKTRLTKITLVQKLFPDDAGVMNARTYHYWPEYY